MNLSNTSQITKFKKVLTMLKEPTVLLVLNKHYTMIHCLEIATTDDSKYLRQLTRQNGRNVQAMMLSSQHSYLGYCTIRVQNVLVRKHALILSKVLTNTKLKFMLHLHFSKNLGLQRLEWFWIVLVVENLLIVSSRVQFSHNSQRNLRYL